MDEEIKNLLERNLEISKETHKIVKKMHRTQKIGRALKIIYWSIIIAGALGAYYYLKPVIGNFIDTYNKMRSDFSAIGESAKSLNPENISPGLTEKIKELFN